MTMREIDLDEAAETLSRLVDSLHGDDEVVLTREGKSVAKLTAVRGKQSVRLGLAEGRFSLPADFDAPLPDDVLALFYDGPIYPELAPRAEPRTRDTGRDV